MMLKALGISTNQVHGYDAGEFTHMAVAAHIASGMADVGIGVETAAVRFGLDFIPLARERYFLAVHRDALDTPTMQKFLALMAGSEYRASVSQLVGYDIANLGSVVDLSQAFGAGNLAASRATMHPPVL